MLEPILIAIIAAWCLIAGLFLAVCRTAARGDAVRIESDEPGEGCEAAQDARAADGEPRRPGLPPETHPLELLLQDRRMPATLKGRVAR
jgi:hypothetical protein